MTQENYSSQQVSPPVNVQRSSSPNVPEQSDLPPQQQASRMNASVVLILFVLLILAAAIGAGIYLIVKQMAREDGSATLPETGEEISDETGSESDTAVSLEDLDYEDPYEEWESYENSDFEVTIQYPADWTLEETVDEASDQCNGFTVTVSKDDYVFQLDIPCASSPSTCIYPDTDTATVPVGASTIEFGDYEEISSDTVSLRRGYSSTFVRYYICKFSTASMLFDTFVDPGYIQYEVPSGTVDEDMLESLDYILQSML